MKKLNSHGFAGVELALILVGVAIIGGVGWFVLRSKDKTNKTYETVSQSNTSASTASTVYKFTELDVQFTLPTAIKNLSHKVVELQDEGGRPADVVYLYDGGLTTLAKKCADSGDFKYDKENTNIAALTRGEGTFKEKDFSTSVLLKQLEGFYISISYPNGSACASLNELQNQKWNVAVTDSQKAFEKAFKNTASEIK